MIVLMATHPVFEEEIKIMFLREYFLGIFWSNSHCPKPKRNVQARRAVALAAPGAKCNSPQMGLAFFLQIDASKFVSNVCMCSSGRPPISDGIMSHSCVS